MKHVIRMNPNRLPELTAKQQQKVREYRDRCRGKATVSVVRKGQARGHICVSVTTGAGTYRRWYNQDAVLQRAVFEPCMDELTLGTGGHTPEATHPFFEG